MSVYHLLRVGYSDQIHQSEGRVNSVGFILIAGMLLFPIGGWLADTYTGRYGTIHCSVWTMWICVVLETVNDLVAHANTYYNENISRSITYSLAIAVAVGLGGFQSNIVQFGIDQLSDDSTFEISSFITWYVLTPYTSGVTLQFISYCVDQNNLFYIKTFAVVFCLSVALCLDFLFQKWLVKEHVRGKSLSLIYNVIKYVVKHRHSFVDDEETASLFNVAKHLNGGPFTNQQVEDVKSMLRVITLITIGSVIGGGITSLEYASEKIEQRMSVWSDKSNFSRCYEILSIHYSDYLFTIASVLIYEFVLHPLYIKYMPRYRLKITTRFLLGIALFFFRILALLSIVIVLYNENNSNGLMSGNNTYNQCIFTNDYKVNLSYKWLLIPRFLSGLSSLFLLMSAIEFIWAQTPYSMTGLAIGTMYAFLGLNTILQSAMASPFLFITSVPWNRLPLTCEIWYFLFQGVFVLVTFIIGVIVVKRYKKRNRNDLILSPSYTVPVN